MYFNRNLKTLITVNLYSILKKNIFYILALLINLGYIIEIFKINILLVSVRIST